MHDLVTDMGREVVRENLPFEPGKRSRIWFHEDASRVLSKEEVRKRIYMLIVYILMLNVDVLTSKRVL
ncbi:hypothetical protein HanIR_Chr08g0355911 [Helianthus annuus]|nr:hypothetical protein HanIR_Chr08g0355911 [Helianthus annuus]